MKRIYTIEDVKQMLESKGYVWSGQFYDKRRTRPMTNEDLWNNDNFELGTTHNNLTTLRIFTINEFEFIRGVNLLPNRDDWTAEWQQLLLEKYPEYATMLLNHAEECIQKINTNLVDETQNLISRLTILKQNADLKKEKYTTIQLQAKEQIKKNNAKQLENKYDQFKSDLTEDMKDFM